MTGARLTELVEAAGRAAKIAPGELVGVLAGLPRLDAPELVVGFDASDDACVWDLGDGRGLIATTDLFPPMVDAPFLLLEGAVTATGGGFTPRSDRGWHYRTPDWVAACGAAGAARSMSRRGHSPGNAAAEGLFGGLKAFGEGGGTVYDTIRGRRERLGLAA